MAQDPVVKIVGKVKRPCRVPILREHTLTEQGRSKLFSSLIIPFTYRMPKGHKNEGPWVAGRMRFTDADKQAFYHYTMKVLIDLDPTAPIPPTLAKEIDNFFVWGK